MGVIKIILINLLAAVLSLPAVAWTHGNAVPVVANNTASLVLPVTNGEAVNTMTATGAPTSWAITSCSTSCTGYFAISSGGAVTVTASGVTNIVAATYTLTVTATNGAGTSGSGTDTVTVSTSGLPVGVTLLPIDGESLTFAGTAMTHTYYTNNNFTYAAADLPCKAGGTCTGYGKKWDDPTWFPIGLDWWNSGSNLTNYKGFGYNFISANDGTNMLLIKNAGLWDLLSAYNSKSPTNINSETYGFGLDEPGTVAAIGSGVTQANSSFGASFTKNRPYHVNFTSTELSTGTCCGDSETATMPVTIQGTYNGSTINQLSVDAYVFAGNASTSAVPSNVCVMYHVANGGDCSSNLSNVFDVTKRGSAYGDMVDVLRGWRAAGTTPQQPIFSPYIELAEGFLASTPVVGYGWITPEEYNWGAWSSIIHGARGILDFSGVEATQVVNEPFGIDTALQKKITAATVANGGGSGYFIGQYLLFGAGSLAKVATVSGSAVQTVTLVYPGALGGNAGVVTPPSNPVADLSGQGATFNLTWATSESVSMTTQVTNTHGLVNAMAPIINSPFAKGFVTATESADASPGYNFNGTILSPPGGGSGPGWASGLWYGTGQGGGMEVMAKWYQGGSFSNAYGSGPTNFLNGFYIFADTRYGENSFPGSLTATFTIPSGYSLATVVGENRTISISGTTFTDTFASASAVHIYMIQ